MQLVSRPLFGQLLCQSAPGKALLKLLKAPESQSAHLLSNCLLSQKLNLLVSLLAISDYTYFKYLSTITMLFSVRFLLTQVHSAAILNASAV